MRVIENNQELRRYQLFEKGDLAGFAQYSMRDNELWLHYTQLKRRHKSEELVELLFAHILDDVHRRRLAIMPFCPAMRIYMAARPEYTYMVPEHWQRRFLSLPETPHRCLDRVRYTGSPKRRSTATVERPVVHLPLAPGYNPGSTAAATFLDALPGT